MAAQGRQRFRQVWGYVRLALLVILTLMLVMQLARANWGAIPPTVVFIALLTFLEAMDRGWLRRFGAGSPPGSR